MLTQATTQQQAIKNPLERAKYQFTHLASTLPRRDNNDPMVTRTVIEKTGLVCKPFWEQADDLEGSAYLAFIQKYPHFDMCMRQEALNRLVAANNRLPKGWNIVIMAAMRPLSVQQDLLETFTKKAAADHPDYTPEQALEYARLYVSDPSRICPPHTTGGTVDVTVEYEGKEVDFGCPINTDGEIAHLHNTLITPEQQANRLTLAKAMIAAGFAPLVNEWWHYSYGDTSWAAFYGKSEAFYDIVPDKQLP